MKYNWNWGILFQTSADGQQTWMMTLVHGLGWTLLAAVCAGVIALVLGSIVGVIRTTPLKWAVRLGNAYVELFRNIPLLVQLFLWYFVLPEVLPKAFGDALKQMPPPWGSFVPAVIGLGLFTSARVAEQVRAGIQALPRGQSMAGTALGLTLPQTYRYVVLPMAYRIILPPLTSETMNLIKNTSVALTIGLIELTAAGALDAGVHVPGVRGVHRGDGDLHRRQPHRRSRSCAGSRRASRSRASSARRRSAAGRI